jgi:hypothetical protein
VLGSLMIVGYTKGEEPHKGLSQGNGLHNNRLHPL